MFVNITQVSYMFSFSLMHLCTVCFTFLPYTRCLFMPDQGVFAVNYVITAAVMGSVLALLRYSQLLCSLISWVYPRSAAVQKYVKQVCYSIVH